MTMVNVRIRCVDTGDALYLQNGFWGPATSVLHAVGRACQDGRIQSRRWNVAQIDEVTTGVIVREALDAITDLDWKQAWGDTDQEQVAVFRARLRDEDQYEIHALEV